MQFLHKGFLKKAMEGYNGWIATKPTKQKNIVTKIQKLFCLAEHQ